MSNKSTNDTSYNRAKEKQLFSNLQNVLAIFKSEINQISIPENTEESKDFYEELDNYSDKENKINKDKNYIYYSAINNINIKFIEKNTKDNNEYNIMNNYDVIFDKDTNKTYLINKRKNFSNEEICNERYKLNQKIKLREDMLLFILIKEKDKDNILIILIKEKKIREEKDEQKGKDEYEDEEKKYFKRIPDTKYQVFYKVYYFRLEIPQIEKNFSANLLNKNGKEEII